MNQIHRPAEKIAFADAAMADSPSSLVEYSFLEPPLFLYGGIGYPSSPSMHFRHRRRANVAWADGHVTAERYQWTNPSPNGYGADNVKFLLGFFGPADNSLFQRN